MELQGHSSRANQLSMFTRQGDQFGGFDLEQLQAEANKDEDEDEDKEASADQPDLLTAPDVLWQALTLGMPELIDLKITFRPKIKSVKVTPFVALEQTEDQLLEQLKLKEKELGDPNHHELLGTLMGLLKLYRVWSKDPQSNLKKGEQIVERLLSVRKARPQASAGVYVAIYEFYNFFAEYDKSEQYCLQSIEECKQVYGPMSLATANAIHNHGTVLQGRAKYPEAISFYEEALAIRKQVSGSVSRDVAASYTNIANCLQKLGRFEQALQYYSNALAIKEQLSDIPDMVPMVTLSSPETGNAKVNASSMWLMPFRNSPIR